MTSSGSSDCPSVGELEEFLAGESGDGRVSAHVEACAACRAELDLVRANNELMDRLLASRDALESGPTWESETAPAVPGYEVLGEIHRGGQGAVYKARQLATRRTVALKVLLAGAFATTRQRLRFEREIDLVAGLRHPNIVTVYDSGTTGDGRLWFAMEYLEGSRLDDYVRTRRRSSRLSLEDALRLVAKICDAVSHAHQRGVIHRDLKPGNVIVDGAGEPHVLDFGLAKPVDPSVSADQATVTVAGGFMGTLAYASPEQARGDPNLIDVRSDVYALGVILYEILTGRFPYAVTGQMSDIIEAIDRTAPRPFRSYANLPYRLGDEIETIARKALAKDPQRRYQSAEALRSDVEHFLAGRPIDAKRDSGWYVLTKTLARYRFQAAAAAAAVVLLAVFGVAMSLLYQRARHEAEKVSKINVFLEDTLGSVEPPGQGEVTVRELLDEGVYWIELALDGQPEIEAAVRNVIGNGYRNLGNFDDAEAQLAAALATRRKLFGDGNLQVATSLNGLGLLRLEQGRHDEAKALFREALSIRTDRLGPNDPLVAISLANLARLAIATGDLDEAETLLQRALVIRRRHLGPRHADVAMILYGLAEVAAAKGRIDDAVTLHTRALAIRRGALHEEHPDVARSLVALGTLYVDANPAAAELLLGECLDRHRRVLPPGHWRTAKVERLLGECLARLNRPDEAGPLLESGYDGLLAALGPDHPETAAASRDLEQFRRQHP